jgi:hypothetical protein
VLETMSLQSRARCQGTGQFVRGELQAARLIQVVEMGRNGHRSSPTLAEATQCSRGFAREQRNT